MSTQSMGATMEVMLYILPAIAAFLVLLGMAKNCGAHVENARRRSGRGYPASREQ